MKGILKYNKKEILIKWDLECGIIQRILDWPRLSGIANKIKGEVFFYQYDLDIAYNGEEKEVFDIGDVVYWRSQEDPEKFGILFMHGNTIYGDATKPRASSPGIKIGTLQEIKAIAEINDGVKIELV